MPKDLTCDDFRPRLNQAFRLSGDQGETEIRLTEALPLGTSRAPVGRRQPFSLVFTGPQTPILPQRIYRVEHPDLGALDMFLVPIGSGPEGTQYQAIFN